MGDIFGSPILTNILLIIIIYGVWELLANLKLINKSKVLSLKEKFTISD